MDGEFEELETERAEEAHQNLLARVEAAESDEEIDSLINTISEVLDRERKREELIPLIENATQGHFENLGNLETELMIEVNEIDSEEDLIDFEEEIKSRTADEWRQKHSRQINELGEERIVKIKKNSMISESNINRNEAMSFLQEENWDVLKDVLFREKNTFLVPITEYFEQSPTFEVGSSVDVYEYCLEDEEMNIRIRDTEIVDVIYPEDMLASINWSASESESLAETETQEETVQKIEEVIYEDLEEFLKEANEDLVSQELRENLESLINETASEFLEDFSRSYERDKDYSYNTNVWEEIKAQIAGAENAQEVWDDWAQDVISHAREEANIGDYDLEVIYVVEVTSEEVTEGLLKAEREKDELQDVRIVERR